MTYKSLHRQEPLSFLRCFIISIIVDEVTFLVIEEDTNRNRHPMNPELKALRPELPSLAHGLGQGCKVSLLYAQIRVPMGWDKDMRPHCLTALWPDPGVQAML